MIFPFQAIDGTGTTDNQTQLARSTYRVLTTPRQRKCSTTKLSKLETTQFNAYLYCAVMAKG